ncbi:hypothetical protein Rs2_23824 [Raphanus sativus]|nr:hypothetical protein Rs2_23824 [Raphanus sativus]
MHKLKDNSPLGIINENIADKKKPLGFLPLSTFLFDLDAFLPKSATTAEAAPVVIEATTHLEEVTGEPKDTNDEKISDVMQILQGLVDRLQKIEEKMDCRLQKMEEKVDLFISLISLNNKVGATFETSSAKAEAENMYIRHESSSDEDPSPKKARANTKIRGQESDERFDPFSFGRGRGQETDGRFGRFFHDGQEDYERFRRFPGDYGQDSYGRFYSGRGRGLFVGGRFRGGRCGGQGFCSGC